jgi:hypothetical protein
MDAKAELAELVEDHLSRQNGEQTVAGAAIIMGLARILTAYEDAKSKRGNWSTMLDHLKKGEELIRPALPVVRLNPALSGLVNFAGHQLSFISVMADEIERLSAGESTLL